jgi:hypothetical protein
LRFGVAVRHFDGMLRTARLSLLVAALAGCAHAEATPAKAAATRSVLQPSLGDAARWCERIQHSSDVPAYCRVQVVDGALTMLTRFDSERSMKAFLGPIAKEVAAPFCHAANRQGLPAKVSVELTARGLQSWDCRAARWSPWAPYSGERKIGIAIDECDHVNATQRIPVGCMTARAKSMSMMTIRMSTEADARPYFDLLFETLAEPFCQGNNETGHASLVNFIYLGACVGRTYSCTQGAWGDWVQLPQCAGEHEPAPEPEPSIPGTMSL